MLDLIDHLFNELKKKANRNQLMEAQMTGKKKKTTTAEQNLKKLWGNIQLHNIYLFRFPKWEEREKEVEDISE